MSPFTIWAFGQVVKFYGPWVFLFVLGAGLVWWAL